MSVLPFLLEYCGTQDFHHRHRRRPSSIRASSVVPASYFTCTVVELSASSANPARLQISSRLSAATAANACRKVYRMEAPVGRELDQTPGGSARGKSIELAIPPTIRISADKSARIMG